MSVAASSTTPLGIGIVGTGFGRKIHIPAYNIHHRTQVVAVYHHDLATAQAIAQAENIPHAYNDLAAMVALPELDAVSLSTPPFLHQAMASTILQGGKHLLMEKPTALNAVEARNLYGQAQAQGVVTAMDFEYRFVPHWQYVAELLQANYVGKPYLIRLDWLMSSRANAQRIWNWYAQKSLGGGALGALGSHVFDYVPWLFGSVARLQAHLSTAITQRPDPITGILKTVDADDTCFLSLQLADGTPCQVALSSVARNGRGHWLEVYGEKGTIVLGSSNQKDYVHGFQLWSAPAGEALVEQKIPDRLQFAQAYDDGRLAPVLRVIDNWVQGIDQGQARQPTLREGVYSQLLMDATHQSAETGDWVDIPDLATFLAKVN